MKNTIKYISLMVTGMLAACGSHKADTAHSGQAPAATSAPAYKLATVVSGSATTTVRLPGVFEPFEFVQIYPKVNGFVKNMYVDRGSHVHKGQVLIRLEAPEVQEEAAAAKLKYAQAQSVSATSRDRYERLLETSKTPGTISPFDLSAAKERMEADAATAQSQNAAYRAQQAVFAYLTVTAPFDGVITERNVHPGALVGTNMQGAKPMLLLQQESVLRLVVSVPEAYSSLLHTGDKVQFTVNSLPGQQFAATISRSSLSLNNYRSETVEIDVNNRNAQLQPGMYGEVSIPIGAGSKGFSVPSTAVVTTTERKYVIAVRNGAAAFVDVHSGEQQGDTSVVFGDLHDGDQIITNATYAVKDGQPIK